MTSPVDKLANELRRFNYTDMGAEVLAQALMPFIERSHQGVEVEAVRNAVLSCPHTIVTDEIILRRSDRMDGNALNQLNQRIASALSLSQTQTGGEWINGEREIFVQWLPKLIATLAAKPDHIDDVARLERLHVILSASNSPA